MLSEHVSTNPTLRRTNLGFLCYLIFVSATLRCRAHKNVSSALREGFIVSLVCSEPFAEVVHTSPHKHGNLLESLTGTLAFHLGVPLRDASVATAMQQRQLKASCSSKYSYLYI